STRLARRNGYQALAANLSQHLVHCSHAGRTPGCEQYSGDVAPHLGRTFFAWLRSRHDLHQQTADAHARNIGARDRQTSEQPHQHPIETVLLWAARATGSTRDGLPACCADQHQVSGINGHTEMFDLTADGFDRRRYYIAAVRDG